MKTTITCLACGHKVSLQEDKHLTFDTGLAHRPDGGHEYTVAVKVGLGRKDFNA